MAQRLYLPIEQVFSNIGLIGTGYKLYTYETGTTTPKATYSNVALSSANTNPIVADSAGRLGDIFVDDLSTYKLILKDADDVEIWDADPVDPKTFSLADFDPRPTSFWGTTAGTSTAYTLDADPDVAAYSSNQTFFFACHTDCGASPTMAVDGLSALSLKKYDGTGSKSPLVSNDIRSGQTYIARNDGVDIIIFNPEIPIDNVATTTTRGYSYIPSRITVSKGTDADHDIDFTAGNFNFDDGSGQAIASALTKQIDATWVAGDNAGGLDTGTVAADTTYHMFAIWNPTTETADFLFSASYSSPTLPSGYTKKDWVMAVTTDGSSNIRAFKQDGRTIQVGLVAYNSTTVPASYTDLTFSDIPTDIRVEVELDFYISDNANNAIDVRDKVTNFQYSPVFVNANDTTRNRIYIFTDTAATIEHKGSVTPATSYVVTTQGWKIPEDLF
jgi:hypothetical protein